MAQVWEIVGGSSRGGIIVREQVSLTSEREVDRLGTGSVVEEVKLVGDRLHYELLYGSGPVEGWVSIVFDSKVLAKRIADPRLHSSTKWAFPDSNFVHSVDLLKKQRASSTKALPDKQPLQTRDKFSEILREEDVLTELDGFPLNRLLPEAEVPDFCKMVVPAWRSLPSGTTWKSTTLAGGNSSLVMLVATDADMSPQRVVYVFNGSADTSSLEPILLSIAASKSGAAPKLYAAIGKHRVMEFVDADQTFGGAFVSHFLAMPSDTTWPGNFHDGPGNPHLMGHIGRAVGLVHALPLDFLQKALLPPDFFNRMSNPLFYPLAHAQFMPVVKDLADKVASSKAIPRSGFFQWPVICHGDLHGGNILSGLQDQASR